MSNVLYTLKAMFLDFALGVMSSLVWFVFYGQTKGVDRVGYLVLLRAKVECLQVVSQQIICLLG